MGTNALFGLIRTLFLLITKRIRFIEESKGRKLTMEDGRTFEVFRHIRIESPRDHRAPGAVFIVRFKPRMSVEKNIRFSLLPMLIFPGFTGFCEKYWGVDRQSGLCQGLYQWRTVRDAENYARSIAMRFMARRSVPESVHVEIIDQSRERYWAFAQEDLPLEERNGSPGRPPTGDTIKQKSEISR